MLKNVNRITIDRLMDRFEKFTRKTKKKCLEKKNFFFDLTSVKILK